MPFQKRDILQFLFLQPWTLVHKWRMHVIYKSCLSFRSSLDEESCYNLWHDILPYFFQPNHFFGIFDKNALLFRKRSILKFRCCIGLRNHASYLDLGLLFYCKAITWLACFRNILYETFFCKFDIVFGQMQFHIWHSNHH